MNYDEQSIIAAGVRFVANRTMTLATDSIEPDCECTIDFDAMPPRSASWREIEGIDPGNGIYLRSDGKAAIVAQAGRSDDLIAAQVRIVAPFAAALQGRFTLHASCVSRGDRAYGFIGQSGNGKSTFALHLKALGWSQVCDDLLSIRAVEGQYVVRARQGDLKMGGLYFLQRGNAESELQNVRLSARDAMLAHLQDGFGELRDLSVWQDQFQVYSSLAREVPSFRLVVPHDLAGVPRFTAVWAESVIDGRPR